MKEQIYTIPINEAYDEHSGCPMCTILKRIEKEAVDYEVGPAMMEPDHRILSNEKGFCKRHLEMMYEHGEKLPLALVLKTHIEEIKKTLKSGAALKKGKIKEITESCVVCDKIEYTMGRYAEVLADMWQTEPEFREKFESSNGFCLMHFEELLALKGRKEFKKALLKKELSELEKIGDDVHRFTLKFDYRNADMEWGTAKDAPKRAVERLVGFLDNEE